MKDFRHIQAKAISKEETIIYRGIELLYVCGAGLPSVSPIAFVIPQQCL